MVLKFAANLNFLFADSPSIASRIKLASKAGFKAIEIPYVENELHSEVVDAKEQNCMKVSLINIKTSSDQHLKFGSASVPGAEEIFSKQLEDTINFAKLMGCSKIHLMAGTMSDNSQYELHWNTYKSNLKLAAERLKCENLIGVIEPINPYSLPNYFLSSFEKASELLREIKSNNLKLMVDIFHLQLLRGNVSNTIKETSDLIGHFQIAQAPHRHEPDVAGELDFNYVFKLIDEFNYPDYIGCEYKPKTNTVEGLKWLNEFNLSL